ncbi:hypothetical protein [Caenimonas koreensis]|uniref:Uncharacterized protein n=1 Tax=Caenimonas koreensis DSM 17982 TaxID=1121255 RepID=A0A844B3U8_9BURK|nr:hypothetical protein [Caenimonas koreensis]MRD46369.1 hypothetical protein [Caenimonas koreensis DSM 17982]
MEPIASNKQQVPISPQEVTNAITSATVLPKDLAKIAADYLRQRPPAHLLGSYETTPHLNYQTTARHLAWNESDRPPAFIEDTDGDLIPVKIHSMDGFDITVEILADGQLYSFDATNGEFLLGQDFSEWDQTDGPCQADTKGLEARVAANESLMGTSPHPAESDLARISALMALREDQRPAIVVINNAGERQQAHMRDARADHVLVEVTEGPKSGMHVFDIARRQLNFEVSESDPVAYHRFLQMMSEPHGRPDPQQVV